MLLSTLGAILLRNLLAGKGLGKEQVVIRTGEGTLTPESTSTSQRRGNDF